MPMVLQPEPLVIRRWHSDNLVANRLQDARDWIHILEKVAREHPEFLSEHPEVYRRAKEYSDAGEQWSADTSIARVARPIPRDHDQGELASLRPTEWNQIEGWLAEMAILRDSVGNIRTRGNRAESCPSRAHWGPSVTLGCCGTTIGLPLEPLDCDYSPSPSFPSLEIRSVDPVKAHDGDDPLLVQLLAASVQGRVAMGPQKHG